MDGLMRPVCFDYFRPGSVEEALSLIAARADEGRFLAGGQSLVPMMNFRVARPTSLIDLGLCNELTNLTLEGDRLVCGTMTTQWDAEHDPLVLQECPLIARGLSFAGYPAIRNRGTVGGSIAHADPVAELLAIASVLDAEMVLLSKRGKRTVSAESFFVAELTTAIAPDEMLREIRFRREAPASRSWFGEAGNHAGGMAQVGVAAYTEGKDDVVTVARFSIIGLTPKPLRLPTLEEGLCDHGPSTELVEEALNADLRSSEIVENFHGTKAYRRTLASALLHDALRAVVGYVP